MPVPRASARSTDVDIPLRPRLKALDVFENADLRAIDLPHPVAPRLDLLGGEVRLVGDEAHLAGDPASRPAVELDLDALADAEPLELGHGDVDLHVLVPRIDHRDDRRARLRELARPDVL